MNRRTFYKRSILGASAGVLGASAIYGQTSSNAQEPDANKPAEKPFERDYEPPKFKPKWKKKQLNREMAQDFVIFAHSDLKMVKQLLEKEPNLVNASIDWGEGD